MAPSTNSTGAQPDLAPPDSQFQFPEIYNFPPFYTLQPNTATQQAQLKHWSSLILSWCRHHRIFRLNLAEALETPLFHNARLKKRLGMAEARRVIDWMSRPGDDEKEAGGGRRAEWVSPAEKTVAWIWWRRPEEWADSLMEWIEETAQKNTVLTVYELVHGDATIGQEFHGMDQEAFLKALQVLVKRGKAQVFGNEDEKGVKFF
ncbi:hypothetical protein VTN31DRAFT_6088 [Thermomyces dupontii]|uniref:uncharacterized protein n=1 Tax=Talaromyces thermophilus TaxID=28565 RepID=UPI003742BD82